MDGHHYSRAMLTANCTAWHSLEYIFFLEILGTTATKHLLRASLRGSKCRCSLVVHLWTFHWFASYALVRLRQRSSSKPIVGDDQSQWCSHAEIAAWCKWTVRGRPRMCLNSTGMPSIYYIQISYTSHNSIPNTSRVQVQVPSLPVARTLAKTGPCQEDFLF